MNTLNKISLTLIVLSLFAFTSCKAGASTDVGVGQDGVSIEAGAEAEAGDNDE